jgi:hypothetical protein
MHTIGVLMCKNNERTNNGQICFQQTHGIYAWCIATFQLPYNIVDKLLTKIYQKNDTRIVLTQEYLN